MADLLDPVTTGQQDDLANAVVEDGPPEQAPMPEDAYNLVGYFAGNEEGQKFLKTVADTVIKEATDAFEGSEEWRNQRKEDNKILVGHMPVKSEPFAGCANAHTPLYLERLMRLVANVHGEIIRDQENVFEVMPTGPDDVQEAEILTIHGNWQIRNEMPDFSRNQKRGLMHFFAAGSVFAHSYRDFERDTNCHEILTFDNVYFPYVHTTTKVDMSDVPYKGKVLEKYRQELETLRDLDDEQRRWSNVDEVLKKSPPHQTDAIPEPTIRAAGAEIEGIVPAEGNKNAPYRFYQHHGFIKFPGANTKLRPYCAVVDTTSRAVTLLYIDEEPDWQDQARFDRETAEYQQHMGDMQSFQTAKAQEDQLRQRLMMPDIDPVEAQMLHQALDQEPLQPPPAPLWMTPENPEPRPVKKVPIQSFSHGMCWDNPFGSLGLSIGGMLAEFNRLANEALNRYYDSATLGNVWSMITTEPVAEKFKGSIPFGPGKVFGIPNVSGNVRDNIMELKPAPANQQLLDLVRMAQEGGDAITVSGIVSGEPGKSGETYRGVALRAERATRHLSDAGKAYLDFLGNILRNNARLNAMFLPDEQIVNVVDHLKGVTPIKIGRVLYQRNYKTQFTADSRFISQAQRVSEADEVVAMIKSMPPLQQNQAFVYQALVDALKARGKYNYVQLLGPPPPAPTTPFGAPPPPPPGQPGIGPNGTMGQPPHPGGPPNSTARPPGPPPGGPPPQGAPIQGPRPQPVVT